MPAVSKAQRTAIAIAEHEPEKLYKRNRGMLDMTQSQMHDFAATKEKHLPARKPPRNPAHEEKADLHGHAAKRGHGGMHAEAYVHGAMSQRHGSHKANHPRTAASGHGYSGSHAQAYMDGAANEADGQHRMAEAAEAEPDTEHAIDDASEPA